MEGVPDLECKLLFKGGRPTSATIHGGETKTCFFPDGQASCQLGVVDRPVERFWDWGATVYLSNDDSMSLASAQRVLYATANGRRLRTSEIRPHELLNYFSFDTAPVGEGQLFSVQGVAEQEGDTLSVAMAVKGANPPRQALDLTLVVDRSCSMQAEGRMAYTKKGMTIMSDSLQEGDRVDLVLFDSSVCTPLENFVVGRDDPKLLTDAIAAMRPTSATDLDAGLREAYRIQTSREAAETHGRNRRVLLMTDANLNAGNVNEALVSEVGRQFEDNDIRLTGVGVGREFNDTMLDKLTEKGKGAYVYLGSDAVVERVFGPGFDSLTRTIAHDVKFSIELPSSLAMEKFYGEESSTNPEDVQPINYYANTSQVFLQDLHMRDGHAALADPVVMKIRYRDALTGEPGVQEYRTSVGALLDGDTHNLHKAQALIKWSDVLLAKAMGGDACGAALTAYTDRASRLSDDAEIAYVNGLVGKTCRVDLSTVASPGVAYRVRVDSDIPIAEVGLECQGRTRTSRLSPADTVARFDDAQPGTCVVTLSGQVAMRAQVDVPEVGGDARCIVRGGRMNCS
jgi:Ca-activated chloride channel family protein